MVSSGPKNRTTAACLAIFLGWAGLHKFYLGHPSVGLTHIALTAVGPIVILTQLTAGDTGSVVVVKVAAWVAIVFGYFYIRRYHFGHSVAEIIGSGRSLLWPWRVVRHTLRLVRWGNEIREDDEDERRWLRRRRRRWGRRGRFGYHDDDDDDDDGCLSAGCIVMLLGLALALALMGVILLLYYLIFSFVDLIALAATVVIGVVEGVRYLRVSDGRFQREYVAGRRRWF